MILPDKYSPARTTTLGLAAALLPLRESGQTVSHLWARFADQNPEATFDRFSESLTLLHLMGIIDIDRGLLRWAV